MEGVTTAIVLFIFVCILFPRLIDNRAQYYIAFVLTMGIILVDALRRIWFDPGDADSNMNTLAIVLTALLQVAAIVLLFMSAGGLTVRGLTKEMAGAFEVIRRGETEKEIIIPIGDQGEKKERKRAIDTIGETPERIDLTAEAQSGAGYPPRAAPTPGPAKRGEAGPLPMD
jgi:hypothetical protein